MSKYLGYKVDDNIKSDYDALIEEKYGYQRNKCGKSVANLMKFNLALEGCELYRDDPDVLELMDKVVDLLEEIKSMKAEIKQLRREVKGKPSKKTGSLADFKKQFKAEYGGNVQVSRRDIVHFVTKNYEVHDSRAI